MNILKKYKKVLKKKAKYEKKIRDIKNDLNRIYGLSVGAVRYMYKDTDNVKET